MNPRFTPVIHVTSDTQAVEQAAIAFDCGADGIFLIDHRRSYKKLLQSFEAVRNENPEKWIGINFLDLHPGEAIAQVPKDAAALWLDNIDNVIPGQGPCPVFAGVAFKYQAAPVNLEEETLHAAKFGVATTSGSGTGVAADINKLAEMKRYLGDKPLAVASGVTLQNLEAHLPYVDWFLVATGISLTGDTLNPAKTRTMANIIHNYKRDGN